ncbi:alpha/beta fold hydrolase [Novosphingobium sp.]|uniref:alpha/beta fold hydrolase n=1 Tax=Novosphingobium sp. TaxID=1874826 RepID=UPI0035AEE784
MSLPLVVVPGILEDQASWRAALAGLSSDVDVFPNEGSSIEAMAASLLARAPERFVLLGHSLGGYVALEAALTAPGRVAGLILVSTSARSETDAARQGRAELVAAAQADFSGVVARLARAALARDNRARCLAQVEAMMLAGGVERFAREQTAAATRPMFADRIGALACPALVITGSEDAVIASAASDELAAAIPHARLVRLMGCGHMPQLEEPAAFLAAVARALPR